MCLIVVFYCGCILHISMHFCKSKMIAAGVGYLPLLRVANRIKDNFYQREFSERDKKKTTVRSRKTVVSPCFRINC